MLLPNRVFVKGSRLTGSPQGRADCLRRPAFAQFLRAKLSHPSTRKFCGAGALLRKAEGYDPPLISEAAFGGQNRPAHVPRGLLKLERIHTIVPDLHASKSVSFARSGACREFVPSFLAVLEPMDRPQLVPDPAADAEVHSAPCPTIRFPERELCQKKIKTSERLSVYESITSGANERMLRLDLRNWPKSTGTLLRPIAALCPAVSSLFKGGDIV
jgi:hypothetical protein